MKKEASVTIIGGGIAGSTTALYLASAGIPVTLIEKQWSLVDGPPFCHLHAGGNLYPEISDAQCLTLLEQSIAFARLYPDGVDHRPTVIALPDTCQKSTGSLLPRMEKLKRRYETLVAEDESNRVLGDPASYFKCYEREALEALSKKAIVPSPSTEDEWLIPFARHVDLDTIQFPVLLVQEYGLNLFRIGARLMLQLHEHPHVDLKFGTNITKIRNCSGQWELESTDGTLFQADYLVNAAGYESGKIDDILGIPCERMVEFKAAYVSEWKQENGYLWPEIIFHGQRGTPRGMGQFTPYPEGYFQLHGMTQEITLYQHGLVSSTPYKCQPKLPEDLIEKIESHWTWQETVSRTENAIKHLARHMPSFSSAKAASKPLFGAQQIPGRDAALRVAEVAFPLPKYARCEIIKVSSVTDMVTAIYKDIVDHKLISASSLPDVPSFDNTEAISTLAELLCIQRGYPHALAHVNVPAQDMHK